MAVIVRIGVAARAVVIDDGGLFDPIDRYQIAYARCPDIARPPRAEEKVAKEARVAADLPRPDAASEAIVGIARRTVRFDVDTVGFHQRYQRFDEGFLDVEAAFEGIVEDRRAEDARGVQFADRFGLLCPARVGARRDRYRTRPERDGRSEERREGK